MSTPRLPGAKEYNRSIRKGKNGLSLLRDDIEELRTANEDNPEVLNFLLKMSGRMDDIFDAFQELREYGQQLKQARTNGEPNGEEEEVSPQAD